MKNRWQVGLQTKTYCPVCYREVNSATCPYCATVLNTPRRAIQSDTLQTLTDQVRHYQTETPMLVRALLDVALYWQRLGRWRIARLYLESVLSLSEKADSPAFLAAVQRQLGGLLVRMGETVTGKHLLEQASSDAAVKREWLRLAIDARDFERAARLARELETIPYFQLEAQAWRSEILARQGDSRANEWATLTLLAAIDQDSDTCIALTRRALGILSKDYKEARQSFEQAILFFRRAYDLYEVAQTLCEMAKLCARHKEVGLARNFLGEATTYFLTMGAIPACMSAWSLLEALPLPKTDKLPELDDTRTATMLLWVELKGAWSDETRRILHRTAAHQGGIYAPVDDGLAVLFSTEQRDAGLVVETALAFYEILRPLTEQSQREHPGTPMTFRMVAAGGILPYELNDMRSLAKSAFFQDVQARQTPVNSIVVDDSIYLETEDRYAYRLIQADSMPQWWTLVTPYQHIQSNILPHRGMLEGYEVVFQAVDRVLTLLETKKQGGLIVLEGLAGTGKTRLLEILRAEIRSTIPALLIHLRGHPDLRHEPFGVLHEWAEAAVQVDDPQERQRAWLSALHRRLSELLKTRPVLLIIDDMHLFDSASLRALETIFPLMAHYPLIILATARPEGNLKWQTPVQKAQRALPERSVRVALPPDPLPAQNEWPDELAAQRVLECAAVLGREFPVRVLRRMVVSPDIARHLIGFREKNVLAPTDDPLVWRFVQSGEQENVYRNLDTHYRQLLHGYAWSALGAMRLPTENHAHHADLHEIALPELIRKLAQVRSFDAPEEALVYYEAALEHYPNNGIARNLLMGKADVLLQLEQTDAAEKALRALNRLNNLTDEQRARIALLEGELLRQVGEMDGLFKVYANAMTYLRSDAPPITLINTQIDVLYEQAMARFRHDDFEIARSLTGTALYKAEIAHLPYQLARLWQLLARLHQSRSNYAQAWQAITHALEIQEQLGYYFCTAESYLMAGNLQEMMGSLKKAQDYYWQALARFEEMGIVDSALHVRLRLAMVALYEGHYDALIDHLEAALKLAPFAESVLLRVQIHSAFAEGLALKGELIPAFTQANSGIELAEAMSDFLALSEGYIALAKVAREAKWWTAARDAIDHALRLIPQHAFGLLRLRAYVTLMDILLGQNQFEEFARIYSLTRTIGDLPGDDLVRARLHLLVGRYRLFQENWNMAAVEVEHAYRRFARLGATPWLNEARELLREINQKFSDEVS